MADKYNFLNFTVFDFETNGLNYMTDQIIEAAVIRVRDGAPTMMFNTLVQLREGKTLPPKITELTGHTEADLEGGINEYQLAATLSVLIPDDELIVAYNAGFDMSFYDQLLRTVFPEDFTDKWHLRNPFLDPLTIARDRSPYPHKLMDMCNKMGIPLDDAHSAQADTLALMDLVIAMHKENDISDYVNVLGYKKKYGEPEWIPAHATLKPQGSETVNHTSKKSTLKPKAHGAVVTKNKKKKLVPDSPKEFEGMLPSTIRIPKVLKDRIDAWYDSGDITLELSASIEGEPSEYDAVMEYLTKVKQLSEDRIEATLDNPAEAHIVVDALPF